MRIPIFRVTSEDYSDPSYPCAVNLDDLYDGLMYDEDYFRALFSDVGEQFTVGGGAAPQFTLTRIR